jgi:hypothetical protein
MRNRGDNYNNMPDVPDPDFVGALAEMWFVLGSAAYHVAYTRVYLQTAALQTPIEDVRQQEQALRDMMQADLIICRAHVAAFFWQIDHLFEALRIAIVRGQKEHPKESYFWIWGKRLDEIEGSAIRQEINAYRNKSHEYAAIIGSWWEQTDQGPRFHHHFLPTISGHEPKEDIDINQQLQQYFEYAAKVWLSFAPGDFKEKFPRSFQFVVSVPHTFIGELPAELKQVRQLEVSIVAQDPPAAAAEKAEAK